VKCRSRILVNCNSDLILSSACTSSENRCTTTGPRPGWLHRVHCAVEFVSGACLSYQYLGHRWTETTHQQRVGRSESRAYWACCRRVHGVSVYALAFVLETDIFRTCDVMWFRDDGWLFQIITASLHYSDNYSNVCLIVVLTAQSDTSNFPYFRWNRRFRHSYVKSLFCDNTSKLYQNRQTIGKRQIGSFVSETCRAIFWHLHLTTKKSKHSLTAWQVSNTIYETDNSTGAYFLGHPKMQRSFQTYSSMLITRIINGG